MKRNLGHSTRNYSDIEILLDPYIDLIKYEHDVLENMPLSLYNAWREWLRNSRSDDRGYVALTRKGTGILATYMGWYESVKGITLKSSHIEPSIKPEVYVINDIDNTIIAGIDKKIRRDTPIFYPQDWAEVTKLIGMLALYLNYRRGKNELQYDLIVKERELKHVITNVEIPYLELALKTWNTTAGYNPDMVYHLAYLFVDANQPKDEQILPNLKEPKRFYRRREMARRLKKLLSKVPERGLRKIIIEGNGIDVIRTHQIERKERTLCLAKMMKMRTEKETIEDYTEAIKKLYPEVYEREEASHKEGSSKFIV